MTPQAYRTALATLGLSQLAAGRWLGVSNKTAQRYATTGPSGAAARAIGMAVALKGLERRDQHLLTGPQGSWIADLPEVNGQWIKHADLSAALDLPAK